MPDSLQETLTRIEALPDSVLLTQDEAAAYLRLAAQTLANDRTTHRIGIPFVRMGRSIRYPKGEIKDWREARTIRTT